MSALVRQQSQAISRVRQREEAIVRRSESIVATALRAPELPDEPQVDDEGRIIVPEGWTEKQFRIAMAAKGDVKKKPIYMEMAAQVTMNAQRLAASRGEAVALALKVVEFTMQKPQYRVVDVTPVDVTKE
jgi:hypothetical protein